MTSECNGDRNNIFEFFTLDGKSIDRFTGNSVGGKTFIKTNLPDGIYLVTPKKSLKLKAEKVVIQR